MTMYLIVRKIELQFYQFLPRRRHVISDVVKWLEQNEIKLKYNRNKILLHFTDENVLFQFYFRCACHPLYF